LSVLYLPTADQILDCEWSYEGNVFTMMCVFFIFVSVMTAWGDKSASIFFNSNFYGRKVNLGSAFGGPKFEIFNSFQSEGINK